MKQYYGMNHTRQYMRRGTEQQPLRAAKMRKDIDLDLELDPEQLAAELSSCGSPETMKLPAVDLLNTYKMRSKRKLWLDIGIDCDVLAMLRQIFLWVYEDREKGIPVDDRKPIWLYIMNYGGETDYEQCLIDTMDASTTPIYTVNLGVCASAAAEIFTAGRERWMMKNARIMFHQGFIHTQGDAQKVNNAMADYNRQLEKAKQFLLDRTNIPAELYEQHKYEDWWLDAEECMKYGVCDHIVNSLEEIL